MPHLLQEIQSHIQPSMRHQRLPAANWAPSNNWQSEPRHLHAYCQAMERLPGHKQKQWASPVLASQRKTVGLLVAQKVVLSPTCVDMLTSPACNWQAKVAMLGLGCGHGAWPIDNFISQLNSGIGSVAREGTDSPGGVPIMLNAGCCLVAVADRDNDTLQGSTSGG